MPTTFKYSQWVEYTRWLLIEAAANDTPKYFNVGTCSGPLRQNVFWTRSREREWGVGIAQM